MDSQRTGNGFGPNPLGFEAINAWSNVRGIRLLQWQVDAIVRMDLKRREVLSNRNDPDGVPPGDERNDRELSPGLFDALFPSKG